LRQGTRNRTESRIMLVIALHVIGLPHVPIFGAEFSLFAGTLWAYAM